MMRIPRLLALTLALSSVALAQDTTAPATTTPVNPPITSAPALPAGQAAVAIGNMQCKAARCTSTLGAGVSDALTTALLNTGKFAVYERENVQTLTEESFLTGGAAFEGIDLLIVGSITQYEPEAGSGGLSFAGISLGKKISTIAMDLRIVDAKTRRIVGAVQVAGKAEGNNFSMTGILPVNVGGQSSPQIEAAISQMLNEAAKQLLLKIPASYYKQ